MLTSSLKRTLSVALAVSLLTAGCAGGVSAPSHDASASAGAASGDVNSVALMPVGPLALPAAEYWAPGEDSSDIATVRVGGCDGESTCPSFAVISGTTATAIGDGEAYLSDGIDCPGGDALTPQIASLVSEAPTEVAGSSGTLRVFTVSCVDDDGEDTTSVEQRQWSAGEGARSVIVVDRWAFADLGDRVAHAQWADDQTQ